MGYNGNLLEHAFQIIEERKIKAEAEAETRKRAVRLACPRIGELQENVRRTAYNLIGIFGMGEDAKKFVENLRNQNLAAQAEIKDLLVEMGYDENYLEPDYCCKICSDTGRKDGKLCSCNIELLRQLTYEKLCKSSPLKISSFEDFSLDYYKNDKDAFDTMSCNFAFCRNYASNFDLNSFSLMMVGETGLGKTHLSLAIAGEVIKKGYGVVYGSVQNLFSDIEKEHFGRADEPDGTTEKILLECDLLILDDLGAEFTTNFTVSTLNNIVNSRLLASRPTIISTNLSLSQLEVRYARRIASRIIGEYQILSFEGADVRQQKAFE